MFLTSESHMSKKFSLFKHRYQTGPGTRFKLALDESIKFGEEKSVATFTPFYFLFFKYDSILNL